MPQNITAKATWMPQLQGLKLPQALVHSMNQSYLLLYSLRDSLQNLQQTAVPGQAAIAYGKIYHPVFTAAPIPNCQITLNQPGDYLITGAIAVQINSGDQTSNLLFELFFNGQVVHPNLHLRGPANSNLMATGQWIVTNQSSGGLAQMYAQSDVLGSGTSQVTTDGTSISGVWVGPPKSASVGIFQ
jgi:hypothetical protein